MAAILEVEALHVAYGATQVLHGIGFAVEARGITTILGANGAGKTTTLRAVSGMVARDGIVRFRDGQVREEQALSSQIKGRVWAIGQDRYGALWFGGEQGLYRFYERKLTHYPG